MARIAIVGVGAIGAVIAALLQSIEQHELLLCTRRPLPHLNVETPEGNVHINYTNITAPSQVESVDWVIVATKTYDAPGAGAWVEHLCKQGAPVAVIQNGVEHRERFAPYVSVEQIVPVIIDCPAERRAPESVHQRGPAELFIQSDVLGRSFAALFHSSAVQITLTADFLSAAWRKLCINSAGSISALLGKPAGVFQNEAIGRATLDVVRECAAVGRAMGAILDEDLPQKVLAQYRNYPADSVNSLLADRLAGRPMETDARIGAIVRFGQQHNIATPLNGLLLSLLEAI
ncbi:2-dehydropantoate 2-reductase [Acidicapsa acidisoli]|uniref:2-dehydropantoate 2-reductase n=1 Tax=Acidicapsa acidisoli TaxID=1615681 RepID=UPI0021E0B378|nr:2-dehydropantoate 2-reductase [Acidicapsa acidisoli]